MANSQINFTHTCVGCRFRRSEDHAQEWGTAFFEGIEVLAVIDRDYKIVPHPIWKVDLQPARSSLTAPGYAKFSLGMMPTGKERPNR